MNELPDAERLSVGAAIVKLIFEPEKTAVEKAKRLIERAKSETQEPLLQQGLTTSIETLIFYKFSDKTREEIQEMLGISETLRAEFKGTVLYNDIKQEIEKEVRETALKEGLEEGMKEGLKEGKLEAAPFLAKAGYSPAEIAESLGLSLDDVNAAIKK